MSPEAQIEYQLYLDSKPPEWGYEDKQVSETKKKYNRLLNHLDLVEANCRKLAFRLIEEGQEALAHELIIEGRSHDLSKLFGEEWQYLCDYDKHKGTAMLEKAIYAHVNNNFHHPEAHFHRGGIHGMKDGDLACLICDWEARGQEFNNPIRQFMEEKAFDKYGFSEESAVFQRMNYFYKLLTGRNL